MTIRFIIILLLPIILHIKGNTVVLVFLIMNSIINLLMQYTKVQIQVKAPLLRNEDRIEELIDQGVSYEEALEDYIGNIDPDDAQVPKSISIAGKVADCARHLSY